MKTHPRTRYCIGQRGISGHARPSASVFRVHLETWRKNY
jgi:hypothetical protein